MQTRRLLPRWRSSEITLKALREHEGDRVVRSRADPQKVAAEARELWLRWSRSPSIGVAADLLNLARFPEAQQYLEGPAKYLIEQQAHLPPMLERSARRVAGYAAQDVGADADRTTGRHSELARLRQQLAHQPRDPIAWIDLARLHTICGSHEKARKGVDIALQLAPDSRFVLRSAARFFSHVREHERAEHLLRRSPRTAGDPWLMATIVSLQAILDRTDDAKRGLKMLATKRFSPADTSELACALGTLELSQGRFRQSRNLLSQGLITPNDNSVAQALWVVTTFSFPISAREEWLSGDFAAEARVYRHYIDGNFEAARDDCLVWQEDEPFSSRPWVAASYVAGLLEEWDHAVALATNGLANDPNDVALRNNLAYALMGKGAISTASTILYQLIKDEQRDGECIGAHTKANLAMHAYRTGDPTLAEKLYRDAFRDFASRGNAGSEGAASVMANFAREAKLAGALNADAILLEASAFVEKSAWPSARLVMSKFAVSLQKSGDNGSSEKRSLVNTKRKWRYDADKNVLVLEERSPFN